ncbi:MAG: hypothetical protein R3F43_32505 [bacterium]
MGATTPADLVAQPEVRAIAQLAFTNIDAGTWRRAPLNLVAVIDKSGSMSGALLDTVKASLHRIADRELGGPAGHRAVRRSHPCAPGSPRRWRSAPACTPRSSASRAPARTWRPAWRWAF